jgi:hypothetical protein
MVGSVRQHRLDHWAGGDVGFGIQAQRCPVGANPAVGRGDQGDHAIVADFRSLECREDGVASV